MARKSLGEPLLLQVSGSGFIDLLFALGVHVLELPWPVCRGVAPGFCIVPPHSAILVSEKSITFDAFPHLVLQH